MSPRTPEQFEDMRNKSINNILSSAITLFSEKGVAQTRITHIANMAGVSKGLVYNYFGTKENIEVAVVKECLKIFDKIFADLPDENNPHKRLENLINTFFASLREDFYHWHLFHQIILQSEINGRFQTLFEENMSSFIGYLTSIFAEIEPDDTYTELNFFNSLLDGIAFDYILMKGKYPLEKMQKKVLKLYEEKFNQ